MEMDFTLKCIKYKTPRIVYILSHFKNINTILNLHDTYIIVPWKIKRSIKTNHRKQPNFNVKLTERLFVIIIHICQMFKR